MPLDRVTSQLHTHSVKHRRLGETDGLKEGETKREFQDRNLRSRLSLREIKPMSFGDILSKRCEKKTNIPHSNIRAY